MDLGAVGHEVHDDQGELVDQGIVLRVAEVDHSETKATGF